MTGVEEKREADKIRSRMKRRDFSESCSVLQSIVPNLLPKATPDEIVRKTTEYIRELEQHISVLEKLKQSMRENLEESSVLSKITNGRSSVDVTVSGGVAFFGIEEDLRRSLVVDIFKVFGKYGVEILAANVAVDEHRQKLMVTVTVNVGGVVGGKQVIEMIRTEILFV